MLLEIVEVPDERLTKETFPVGEITQEVIELLENMTETMIEQDGVGLAAPQVGENLQIAVVDLGEEEGVLELINPRISLRSGSDIDVEGCLSIPHLYGTVERATKIVVSYYDREGDSYQLKATDYLARIIQHEVDHLEGVLFTEKMIEEIPEAELEAYMEQKMEDENE